MTDTTYDIMISRCLNEKTVETDPDHLIEPEYGPWEFFKKMTLEEDVVEATMEDETITGLDVIGAFLDGVQRFSYEAHHGIWEPADPAEI